MILSTFQLAYDSDIGYLPWSTSSWEQGPVLGWPIFGEMR